MLALTSAGMASGSRGEEGGGADEGGSDARTCEMPIKSLPVLPATPAKVLGMRGKPEAKTVPATESRYNLPVL